MLIVDGTAFLNTYILGSLCVSLKMRAVQLPYTIEELNMGR